MSSASLLIRMNICYGCMENSIDPDQKPAELGLHCFEKRTNPGWQDIGYIGLDKQKFSS